MCGGVEDSGKGSRWEAGAPEERRRRRLTTRMGREPGRRAQGRNEGKAEGQKRRRVRTPVASAKRWRRAQEHVNGDGVKRGLPVVKKQAWTTIRAERSSATATEAARRRWEGTERKPTIAKWRWRATGCMYDGLRKILTQGANVQLVCREQNLHS